MVEVMSVNDLSHLVRIRRRNNSHRPIRLLVSVGTLALILSNCGGGSSSSPTTTQATSQSGSATSPSSASPPSFDDVKTALESTGITLCDESQPGNLTEHIYAQSTTSDCSSNPPGGGLIRIFTENDTSSSQSDA